MCIVKRVAVCVSFVYSYDLLALGRRFSETVLFFSANIFGFFFISKNA